MTTGPGGIRCLDDHAPEFIRTAVAAMKRLTIRAAIARHLVDRGHEPDPSVIAEVLSEFWDEIIWGLDYHDHIIMGHRQGEDIDDRIVEAIGRMLEATPNYLNPETLRKLYGGPDGPASDARTPS